MRRKILGTTIASFSLLIAGVTLTPAAQAATASCSSITKAVVVADGYKSTSGPTTTPYNFTNTSVNQANALGTTIDFGAKALVVGCVSPSDIAKFSVLAQGSKKPIMNATQYLAYVVKQSAGAMKKTAVGGVSDYLDFGNGKEDGVGSTANAGSLRLDAWVAGKFVILTFSAPAAATPPTALLSFIKTTKTLL
ncbi:MAG TPA: hypothetical protein VIH79_00635 [Candidatus Nanopelagicaceae bacterium]